MLSRISVVFRLLTITAVSLLALAGVGTIGVVSTGTVQEMVSRNVAFGDVRYSPAKLWLCLSHRIISFDHVR
jgi:hypothetical protein